MSDLNRNATIAASAAISTALGSIHAFSVFVSQWERLPGADRASVSLVYSIALVSLTAAVLLGYRIYQQLAPFAVFTIVGVLSAIGLATSASSSSVASLYLTYGVLFGGANGLGYGYALQLSGQAAPVHRGFAMGLVTAFYAVGATVAPLFFVFLINNGGNAFALKVSSAIVLVVSLVAAATVKWSNAFYESEPTAEKHSLTPTLKQARALLWAGYGSAVTAGLMIIAHAYGIALWMNLNASSATWATTIVAFGNMLGGFSAGYYADRVLGLRLLRWLPLFTSLGLILLVWPLGTASIVVFIALALVGYCYGAIIAVYPVAVADLFGALAAPRIYGQVFTAWGLAGLLGPWVSGWLFDLTGSYSIPIVIAVSLSAISVIAISHCLSSTCTCTHRQ